MSRLVREIALLVMLPPTRAMMYVTTRLLEEDRKAHAARSPSYRT
ncbi:hypothetical protein [Lichenicoccus roseus]|nr:hypothetical protein [Lichenicoccus roseus]